ncbi:uncharacterized protein BJ171DRAFT_594818 [Polychytrium aggregatum]|uniref:uncharacterized protein n=1 Tax=Polychytrium aggregatum TaxID=110093 RepID=UPI0022FDE2B2|nr:uncharacterized protein BJ171DRAFT_594818 [Polychytrium aggregatum]KAI9209802.1 hypothetical protein BJ171DRAFT_594818 [Polychytrium aggregatum]
MDELYAWLSKALAIHLRSFDASQHGGQLAASKPLGSFLAGQSHDVLFIFCDDTQNIESVVSLTPLLESPVNTLYQTIHNIYAPMLMKSSKLGVTPKLQGLLSELDFGLASELRHQSGGVAASSVRDENPAGIFSIDDEYIFWVEQATEYAKTKVGFPTSEKERAAQFRESFQPLKIEYDKISSIQIIDILEIIEKTQDTLDDLWQQAQVPGYPQERMLHLLGVVTNQIVANLQEKLASTGLMKGDLLKVKESLHAAIQVCERLQAMDTTLTGRLWPNVAARPWTKGVYRNQQLDDFVSRLNEIVMIRSSHDLLSSLLLSEEQKELRVPEQLDVFSTVHLLVCNNYTSLSWKTAVDQYNKNIQPIQHRVAAKLRSLFNSIQSQPRQLLREFQRYRELLSQEVIARQLVPEREALLEQLINGMKQTRAEFTDKSNQTKFKMGKNLPTAVSKIIWARQAINKIEETDKIVENLSGPKSSYTQISSELYEELKRFERDQFAEWVADIESEMDDPSGSLLLKKNGNLMDLDYSNGKLRVNYDDRLVTILRQARQLTAFGFPVPAKIQRLTESAQKYYRHGVVLKQVAHFYNTIDQQMLPCQQAMLLEPALAFEQLVKNAKGRADPKSRSVTWDSPFELELYISQLQASADKLTRDNRRLRKFHMNNSDVVVGLMSVDLVKCQSKWKESLSAIRSTIGSVQDSGIKMEDTLTWRIHWDHQLYKALEHQYQVGLETLNESLPEMKVDLVFKQQKLQFRPPFEEIRAKYYREMKKFITIPSAFRGVGDGSIFALMIDRNAKSLSTVYQKAESLFQNLNRVFDIFKDWVIVGTMELDAFVEEALGDVTDWELNFRMLKVKGKEAERLPTEIKIDCITVSTAPVKATIDDHLQRLFDSMLLSLRKSVGTHMMAIDDFVNRGLEMMAVKPNSLAEVGEANAKHEELSKTHKSIQAHFDAADLKNKLLKSVSASGVDISAIQSKWSKLELMLESHELMIKEQVEQLRSAIDSRRQSFLSELEKFTARWNQLKPKVSDITSANGAELSAKAVVFIVERKTELEELEKRGSQIVDDSAHFGIGAPDFAELHDVSSDIRHFEEMWGFYAEYTAAVASVMKEDWISFRLRSYSFEDMLTKWMERIRSREMDTISATILQDIDKHKRFIGCLKFLKGENWMSEHWGELFRILAVPKGVSLSELTFGHLSALSETVLQRLEDIKELNSRANGEIAIREAIQELDIWGAGSSFGLTEYKDAKGTANFQLIKDWKDILTQIGDNQSLLQSLKDSPYYKNFADKAMLWEQKLVQVDEYLRNLNTVQRKWVYLEPIFNRGALPAEQNRFARIDEDFRGIMSFIAADARIISIINYPSIGEILKALVDQLERCQKALNEYLEQKRDRFARFYFLGDEDLLEILGQSKNPNVIQSHLKKLFAGVHNVEIDGSVIVAMKSAEGETVQLRKPVQVTEQVEVWLENFALEMKETLKSLLQQCLKEHDMFRFPSQVLGLSEYLHFTANCETAITKGSLTALSKDLKRQLDEYTSFDSSTVEDSTERHVVELKVKSQILDVIHFLEVVRHLQESNVTSLSDWAWKRQLRFYMTHEGQCVSRMNDAEFHYTFEYQGNPPKLVHTPLTDKCYLTLTQAMASGFGGNPFGPAGTGKTESVKALGVLFGRQVLVFNCDEGIDYKSMGRIFVGLVKCGAWGCFDEFNRLEEAVLSAVSQQIQVIQAALKMHEPQVALLGKPVDLNPHSGIFVTLNPAGKNYGGRQKLPDNLKQLFRSVAMTHPNNELISEVILFSEGFQLGKELGSKVVAVFTCCKQLLSIQQHYDWGLRPLKTTLWLAGQLLHQEKKNGPVSTQREMAIVVKALRVNTLSKLTHTDSKRFLALMKDIFPGVQVEDISYEELGKCVREAYDELKLVYIPSQAEKIFQFYEACRQRMGVVVVGPSGSGKSTLWRILKLAWQKCGTSIKQFSVNPKAIDRQALLGHMDMDTREWFDGVLTFASREAVKQPLHMRTWIICDGDVDPEWVESLNSVLDDNRLLTMPNGERIQFGPNVNFIFETHNLKFASPATVSRMGMIYLSDENLDMKALVKSWLEKQNEKNRGLLNSWIDELFYKSIDWIIQNCEAVVETSKTGLVMNGLSQLSEVASRSQFLFALVRGLGGNLTVDSRLAFANEMLMWAKEPSPDPKRTLDFYVNKDSGRVEMYQIEAPCVSEQEAIDDIDRFPVVETADVKRSINTIMPWLTAGHPLLLVGPEGSGKHMLLRYCFQQLKGTTVATIHCSAQTRSSHILQRLNQNCLTLNTNTGRVLRPKDSERLVLYLKDINLPKPDKYETVELVQFLQQLITYNGFYDKNLEWICVEHIQIVASMNPSSTMGRHRLTTRLTSVMRQYAMTYSDREQLHVIYRILTQTVLSPSLASHKVWGLPKNIQKLACTMVSVYDQTVQKFTVDMRCHYRFTPRDLSRWVLSLSRFVYTSEEQGELLDILAYEAERLFQDRLIESDSRQKFQLILSSTLRNDWGHQPNIKGFVYISGQTSTMTAPKMMSQIKTDAFRVIIEKHVSVYERDNQDLNMRLFPEAVEGIAKIERVLSQPNGSLLLAGRPGMGRQSSLMIVGHMLRFKTFSPNIGRSYGIKAFSADIKTVLQSAGVHNEEVLLILEDYQIVESSFLESINSLLSGGEVPGLYSPEELDQILSALKDSHGEDSYRGSVFEYFVARIRKNLHFALVLDTSSQSFVQYYESNPALSTCCHMSWMDSWSQESSLGLIKDTFKSHALLSKLPEQEAIVKGMLAIHESSLSKGSTPKHLIEFLSTYERVYVSKLTEFESKNRYLLGGLEKLREAAKYVDNLSAEARKQGIELATKQKEADKALKQITESMLKASEQKKEMESLNHQLKEEERALMTRKTSIEKDLSEVDPIVQKAKEAVGGIKPESLSEIRSLRAPPPAVRDVLEGVLRLMGILDMSWNSMKGFLGKRTVKDEIMNFDARNITKSVRESVQELLQQKKESFEEVAIKRASVAAAPLAMWVKANIQYSTVLERVSPLEADLARLTESLDASRQRVVKLRDALVTVDNTVAQLRAEFGSKTGEAELLRSSLEKAQKVIANAQELLDKLSGEGQRWAAQGQAIKDQIATLPKNGLLAAGFIAYLAGQSEDQRFKITQDWAKLLGQRDFDIRPVLSTESQQLVWKSEGLPSDTLSIENAITILNGGVTPLIIDPSGQATIWLKTHLQQKKPETLNQGDESFLRSLELAIRFGKTLVIQELKSIEPVLYPVLRKSLIKQGPRFMIQLGDKLVDYHDQFSLYLVTRKVSFSIPPDAAALVNQVNFTITRAGLAAQLLGVTLKHEKPQLEIQKIEILKQEEELKIQLAALEESLLKELANSEGNILENTSLIKSLNETKEKSIKITTGLQESHRLQESLDAERDKFRPLSDFGSRLFFIMSDLKKINSMYEFSLASFLQLFEKALSSPDSTSADGTDLRIKLLMGALEKLVYRYVSRSIFKSDRQMFALYMIRGLHGSLIEAKEWDYFIGQVVPGDLDEKAPESPGWVPTERKQGFQAIQQSLTGIYASMNANDNDSWARWVKSPSCEVEFPPEASKKLGPFQKLILVQCLRPDRLLSAMHNFSLSCMRIDSIAPPVFNIKRFYHEETKSTEPILFITTPGADPTEELKELADSEITHDMFFQISMGQGQGDLAVQQLHHCAKNGGWLYLQNVHLVSNWLSVVENELSILTLHPKFRLWLTSEAHPKFPVNLLQSSIKITVEAPPGIKKNMQLIQERRTYIPQGWNKFYEFSAADLRSSSEVVSQMCDGNSCVPQWQILHGLLKEAIYGGRIDDSDDARKLEVYLQQYFNDDIFALNGRQPTKRLAKGIVLPNSSDHESYVKLINDLPEVENISLLGLPANIDMMIQISTSSQIVDQLKMMKQVDLRSQNVDKEKWSKLLLPFLQLWKKLNTGNDLLQKKMGQTSDTDPIHSFLTLELSMALGLLRQIHMDLSLISKVIRGTALATNDVTEKATALIHGNTPESWLSVWDGSKLPHKFLREALLNGTTVNEMRDALTAGTLWKSPIKLQNLLNPATFLSALRQESSRRVNSSMDNLHLLSTWKPANIPSNMFTVAIQGLLLQGCIFDGSNLTPATASDPPFQIVPTCYIAWVPKDISVSNTLEFPLYATPAREKLIARLQASLYGWNAVIPACRRLTHWSFQDDLALARLLDTVKPEDMTKTLNRSEASIRYRIRSLNSISRGKRSLETEPLTIGEFEQALRYYEENHAKLEDVYIVKWICTVFGRPDSDAKRILHSVKQRFHPELILSVNDCSLWNPELDKKLIELYLSRGANTKAVMALFSEWAKKEKKTLPKVLTEKHISYRLRYMTALGAITSDQKNVSILKSRQAAKRRHGSSKPDAWRKRLRHGSVMGMTELWDQSQEWISKSIEMIQLREPEADAAHDEAETKSGRSG